MFVVKANGYGHGALPCAKAAVERRASEAGRESGRGARTQGAAPGPLADWLGVSSVEEGISLRKRECVLRSSFWEASIHSKAFLPRPSSGSRPLSRALNRRGA